MNNGKCLSNWVIPEKIHTPTMEGMLENLTAGGGGVNDSNNPDGRGGSEPNTTFWPHKLHSSMFPSLKSVSFEKLLCVFKFYYSFKLQTSYHIYFKLSSIGSHRILGELRLI